MCAAGRREKGKVDERVHGRADNRPKGASYSRPDLTLVPFHTDMNPGVTPRST